MRGGGVIVGGVLCVVAACGGAQPVSSARAAPDTTPVTVRVGHVASTAYAPLYVAIDRGYFDRLHVKVDLQAIRAGQDPIDLVARGEEDAVVTDLSAGMFNSLASGQRFKVVGSMAAVPADGTTPLVMEVAKPLIDSGRVKTLADLKGRKVAITGGAGSGGGYLTDLVLEKAGVGLQDTTVVDLSAPSMEVAIASTGIDAALVPGPFTTRMEQHGVTLPMGAPPPGSTWSGVLFGSRLGGSAALRFFEGLVRGARDLQGSGRTSDDTLVILAKYTGVTPDVLKSIPPYDWDLDLRPDAATVAAMQATYRKLGLLKYDKDLVVTQYVDATYSRRAAALVH
jgi:NitT/TauT family transport system substrate-binding protein